MNRSPTRMRYEDARRLAGALVDEFRPVVHRIEAAGSLRRQARTIPEIDLVAIPRTAPTGQATIFDDAGAELNLLWNHIERIGRTRIRPLKPTSSSLDDDELWYRKSGAGTAKRLRLWLVRPKMVVDLYMTTPERWGVQFAIRTGSKEFAKALVSRWTNMSGGHVHDGRVHPPCLEGEVPVAWHTEKLPSWHGEGATREVPLGPPYLTPEEGDVFDLLGVRYVPPPLRKDATALGAALLSKYVREGTAP